MKIKTPHYFLDANIWVRVLPYDRISNLLSKIEIKIPDSTLLACTELIDEIKEVLSRPKFIEKALRVYSSPKEYLSMIDAQIQDLKEFATPFINHAITIKEFIPPDDPDDQYIYNLAKQYNCTVITGDKHLLQLKKTPFRMIHADEFLKWL